MVKPRDHAKIQWSNSTPRKHISICVHLISGLRMPTAVKIAREIVKKNVLVKSLRGPSGEKVLHRMADGIVSESV